VDHLREREGWAAWAAGCRGRPECHRRAEWALPCRVPATVLAPLRRNERSGWGTAEWQGNGRVLPPSRWQQGVGRAWLWRMYCCRAVVSCPGSAEIPWGARREGAGREAAWRGTPESRRACFRERWERPMYRAGVGRGFSQRTWSKSGRRVCWMPVSQKVRAWSSLPPGPRGRWERQCCPPRVATSIRFWCV